MLNETIVYEAQSSHTMIIETCVPTHLLIWNAASIKFLTNRFLCDLVFLTEKVTRVVLVSLY